MKAHCLQHVSFEGMGAIETWLLNNKFEISFTRFYETTELPEIKNVDWIIIMGGPMSVKDELEFPWLVAEKEFIRQCIAANKVIVGICLGAQLIANALGSKIYINSEKEIGWFPIRKHLKTTSGLFTDFPEETTVFHWHGETFDLPAGAELIASSEACKNQVFCINDRIVGFQCHLETNPPSLNSLITNCRSELITSQYVQNEQEIIEKGNHISAGMNTIMFTVLDKLAASIG